MMNKVVIGFELPNEMREFKEGEGEKPFAIFKEYTLSMFEKASLYKLVTGIIGKPLTEEEANNFQIESLIGQTCLLNVIHKIGKESGKERAEIQSAAPLPKGMEAPAPFNKPQILDYENWDEGLFESLPEFLKEKVMSSLEYAQHINPTPADESHIEAVEASGLNPDDIPF